MILLDTDHFNDVLFLTANRRDFEKVPGLRFENWLE